MNLLNEGKVTSAVGYIVATLDIIERMRIGSVMDPFDFNKDYSC